MKSASIRGSVLHLDHVENVRELGVLSLFMHIACSIYSKMI